MASFRGSETSVQSSTCDVNLKWGEVLSVWFRDSEETPTRPSPCRVVSYSGKLPEQIQILQRKYKYCELSVCLLRSGRSVQRHRRTPRCLNYSVFRNIWKQHSNLWASGVVDLTRCGGNSRRWSRKNPRVTSDRVKQTFGVFPSCDEQSRKWERKSPWKSVGRSHDAQVGSDWSERSNERRGRRSETVLCTFQTVPPGFSPSAVAWNWRGSNWQRGEGEPIERYLPAAHLQGAEWEVKKKKKKVVV